jgi:hypothetical protein
MPDNEEWTLFQSWLFSRILFRGGNSGQVTNGLALSVFNNLSCFIIFAYAMDFFC